MVITRLKWVELQNTNHPCPKQILSRLFTPPTGKLNTSQYLLARWPTITTVAVGVCTVR
jgi:hypothetical protein